MSGRHNDGITENPLVLGILFKKVQSHSKILLQPLFGGLAYHVSMAL